MERWLFDGLLEPYMVLPRGSAGGNACWSEAPGFGVLLVRSADRRGRRRRRDRTSPAGDMELSHKGGRAMASRTRRIVIILGFLTQFFSLAVVYADSPKTGNQAGTREAVVSVSLPPKDRLILVSYAPLIKAGLVLGRIAAYDDSTTKRPVDYVEFYDNAGMLVAVSWFDRFGIERLAVDRALLEDTGMYQGVFVMILEGSVV